jgi:predicted transcriptional regulator
MKKSLSQRILNYIRQEFPNFVNGGQIERLTMEAGYKASNASRRCRELHEEGLLVREERKNENTGVRSVWYKARDPKEISQVRIGNEIKKLYNW